MAGFAQDAQSTLGNDPELIHSVLRRQFVLAEAKKREVVILYPVQKDATFGYFRFAQTDGRQIQFLYDGAHLLEHRLPIGNRSARIGKDREQTIDQRLQPHRIGLAVDFYMHERFRVSIGSGRSYRLQLAARIAMSSQHRVNEELQGVPLPVNLHGYGIDQERHVVIDDLDNRMRRRPAVFFKLRVVGPKFRLAAGKGSPVGEMCHGRAIEVFDASRKQVLGIHLLVVDTDEGLRFVKLRRRQPAGGQLQNRGKNILFSFLEMIQHSSSFLRFTRQACRLK